MNPNEFESRLIRMLKKNYLDESQRDHLVEEYASITKRINGSFLDDEIELDDNFILELACCWAAEEVKQSEFYQHFVRQLLIKDNFIYLLRDCFLLDFERKDDL